MLVIHAGWARDALCVWAEDSALPATAPEQAGRRPSRVPRPHPFAADPDTLADRLAGLGGDAGDLARKAEADELALWLPAGPAGPGGPQAAPELIRPAAGPAAAPAAGARRGGQAALGCWRIPALAFAPRAALGLLAELAVAEAPGDLMAGGSVAYWAAVTAFAGDLAARGRVLPSLGRAGEDWLARWEPVLTGHDARRAGELAGAMPPVCRATEPGGEPPGSVLAAALGALADAAARARLATGDPGWALLPPRRGRRPARIPVAERWAQALVGPDDRVEVRTAADAAEAVELAGLLDGWREAVHAPAGPVRTCFRLVEPGGAGPGEPVPGGPGELVPGGPGGLGPGGDGEQPWRVEFALQSAEDPSLMVAADDVWAGAGTGVLGGTGHPEEQLLAGLGGAARLFPGLEVALRSAAPGHVDLDTAGALRFLRETGPLLAAAGFGVLLPDWARKARLGLKLTSRTRQAASAAGGGAVREPGLSLADLVEFRYDLAVGDTTLDPAELAELARLKIPLVRLRGQWVELDERNLQAALRFLERGGGGVVPAGDVLLAGLRGVDEDLPVTAVDADGWLGDLLSGEPERRLAPVPAPPSFHGELRPYQQRGLAWLSFLSGLGLGGILADDMGLGKTVMMLALLARDRAEDRGPARPAAPTLLVCPMSLTGNWQREAERFAPGLTVHVHHGADRLSGPELRAAITGADLVITTYGLAARDHEELAAVSWHRVVCDEAQNIKNAATRAARAVRGLPAASRIALTGTPVENRLGELWSIMEFTSPGLLGPAAKFRENFAVPVERHGDEAATARLKRLTGPFILRREKTDRSIIADLPDKAEMKVWCNLTPEQASLYQATVADMMQRIESAEADIERRGLVLATMAKLKQVCNHPAHLLGDGSALPGRSGKLARLEETGEEIVAAGDKALCFTQYAEFGRVLQPYLAARLGCPVFYLHGGTTKKARDHLVAEFQGLTQPAVFLLSLKAGGTGLNLTGASHVIHFDRWWNPAVEDQATDRAYRIGQRRDVQVRKFVCVGTVEERIDAMIEEKKALAQRVVGTGEGWLADLSVDRLREVLTLAPEAVAE